MLDTGEIEEKANHDICGGLIGVHPKLLPVEREEASRVTRLFLITKQVPRFN